MTLRRFSLLPTCSMFQKSCAKNNGFQLFSHKCICVVISQISGEREKLSISKVSDLMKFSVKPRMAPGGMEGVGQRANWFSWATHPDPQHFFSLSSSNYGGHFASGNKVIILHWETNTYKSIYFLLSSQTSTKSRAWSLLISEDIKQSES